MYVLALLLAVTLTWTDNSSNELGFYIEKTISGNCTDGWFDVAQTGVDIAIWVDDLAQPGDCYRVSAYNEAGESMFSNTAQVPTIVEPPPEPPPEPCHNKGKKCR